MPFSSMESIGSVSTLPGCGATGERLPATAHPPEDRLGTGLDSIMVDLADPNAEPPRKGKPSKGVESGDRPTPADAPPTPRPSSPSPTSGMRSRSRPIATPHPTPRPCALHTTPSPARFSPPRNRHPHQSPRPISSNKSEFEGQTFKITIERSLVPRGKGSVGEGGITGIFLLDTRFKRPCGRDKAERRQCRR